jgi:hypothetical protein
MPTERMGRRPERQHAQKSDPPAQHGQGHRVGAVHEVTRDRSRGDAERARHYRDDDPDSLAHHANSVADPLTNCRRENGADGRQTAGRAAGCLVPPTFERARGAILPCVLGSLQNRQQRGERARGAAPSCALGSSQNRQRRGVGSRFLRFLAQQRAQHSRSSGGRRRG